MWSEFKAFAMKGNIIDLAIGVIIGGAFGKIVTSLVNDVITPLLGILLGGVKFTELAVKVGAESLAYGKFIQSVVDFFIVAVAIFLMIKALSSLKRKKEVAPEAPPATPAPSAQELLLMEIRDLLKKGQQ